MAYISLQSLKEFLGLSDEGAFFTDKESVFRTLDDAYAANKTFTQGKNSFSQLEITRMVAQLKDEVILVFDQWVRGSKSLEKLLVEEELVRNDFGEKLAEHQLFPAFQRFITIFLVPELNRFLDQHTEKHQLNAASYIPLLDERGQFIIQDKLVRHLDTNWNKLLAELEQPISSAEFNEKVKHFFLPQQIETLNYFTKPFYARKVKFIEDAIGLFRHPEATAPFVLWMTRQMQNLHLNPEHRSKVQDIHASLLQGDQRYFTSQSRIQSWSLSQLLGMVAVLALVGFSVFYLVNYTGMPEEKKEKTATSFSKFSKEERMQLDSLIRTMEHRQTVDENYVDQQNTYLHLTPVQVQVNSREPLRNKLAEQYVQDCMKAYDLSEMNLIDSCSIYSEKKLEKLDISPFRELSYLKGKTPILLRNESDYQVQVLIFEEKSDGEVYSAFVQGNKTVKCKVNPGYRMILIPGNNLGKAQLPQLSGISGFYRHHFCFMDGNYLSQLFQVYSIKDIREPEIKILLNSTAAQQLYVVDLYEALEVEN
ncbi:MAG: hypothetical protein ACO1O6_00065 [Bacteroidota bacterium]